LVRSARDAVADRRQIVIFPEGTRAAPGEALKLQPGIAALAAATHLPVLPVVTDSGRCWSRRAFRKYPGTIHILVLPPIPPDLPRAELMAGLVQAYRNGVSTLGAAVDGSVGQAA
jgi:1-acyl-sn-glycerol-3-phosphate acyltransferase